MQFSSNLIRCRQNWIKCVFKRNKHNNSIWFNRGKCIHPWEENCWMRQKSCRLRTHIHVHRAHHLALTIFFCFFYAEWVAHWVWNQVFPLQLMQSLRANSLHWCFQQSAMLAWDTRRMSSVNLFWTDSSRNRRIQIFFALELASDSHENRNVWRNAVIYLPKTPKHPADVGCFER